VFTLCTCSLTWGIYPAMLYWSPGTDVTGLLADLAERRCRVEAIRYVLSCLPYAGRDERAAGRPDPLIARRRETS
jgi:hypothetical protein